MKKILIIVLLPVLLLCGCYGKTEYDGKTVEKIEYAGGEGMFMFPVSYIKTFDFVNLTVSRECRASEEDCAAYRLNLSEQGKSDDEIEEIMSRYNNVEHVTDISQEAKTAFLSDIEKNGIYTWKDKYETNDIVCDGASHDVTLYFSDGTAKSTTFYYKQPSNYDKIVALFQKHLNTSLHY